MTMKIFQPKSVVVAVTLALLVTGCSVVDERKEAYKDAELQQPLEVPPDLLSVDATNDLSTAVAPMGTSVTLSEFTKAETGAQGGAAKAPKTTAANVGVNLQGNDVQIAREGNRYWLVVNGEPGKWWDVVKRFWLKNEIEIERENKQLGLIYTKWFEDKREVPKTSLFEKAYSSLRSDNLRDQYVVRIEASTEAGKSEIHIAHQGMMQVEYSDNLRWLPRERDTELEIAMIKKLALFVDAGDKQVEAVMAQAETVVDKAILEQAEDKSWRIKLNLAFPHAWREVGDVITASKIDIEDFNRSSGAYYLKGNLLQDMSKSNVFSSFLDAKGEVKPFLLKIEDKDMFVYLRIEGREGSTLTADEVEHFMKDLQTKF